MNIVKNTGRLGVGGWLYIHVANHKKNRANLSTWKKNFPRA